MITKLQMAQTIMQALYGHRYKPENPAWADKVLRASRAPVETLKPQYKSALAVLDDPKARENLGLPPKA